MSEKRPKRRRRRFLQFSLRTLLVVMLLVSIGMSWLAVRRHRVRRQREAVEAIKELGGRVQSEEGTQVPSWLRESFGDELSFLKVHAVDLNGTRVTDAGLEHVKGLTNLQQLDLCGTQVTDARLEHLQGLIGLDVLYLDHVQVTDAGLENFEGLTGLRRLNLRDTQVTDAGVNELKKALPNCRIYH